MESLIFVGQILGLATGPINITANINISIPKPLVASVPELSSLPSQPGKVIPGTRLIDLPEPDPIQGPKNVTNKLEALRNMFSHPRVWERTTQRKLDAYLLPSTDAHLSENMAEADLRVGFLSGFSGNTAFIIVTDNDALIWIEDRDYVEAKKELSSSWTLMRYRYPENSSPNQWIVKNLKNGSYVGFDPELFTYEDVKMTTQYFEAYGIKLVPIPGNLVDDIWLDRPEVPHKKLVTLTLEETGQSSEDKLKLMLNAARENGCVASLYTALDDIMWLLNVRGWDIPYNPVALSYLLITETETVLFIDERKLDDKIRELLGSVKIEPYESLMKFLEKYRDSQLSSENQKILLPTKTNFAIGSLFEGHAKFVLSPAQVAKSVKNEVELKGSRATHIEDSILLTEFFYWLEQSIKYNMKFPEIELSDKIDTVRSKEDGFMGKSFETISAAGEHSALPYYQAIQDGEPSYVEKDMVYMLSSGAHYRTGTTDVTRTIWTGNASTVPADFIRANTLVLKGHINLARTVFPKGTMGGHIDALARQALWSAGLSYSNPTGHGFGHFLNVPEGQIGIGPLNVRPQDVLKAGMFMTIGPGYYLEGKWGIRIENDYEIVSKNVASGSQNYLGFEPLTLVPINLDIVDLSLLDKEEKTWLKDYNERVVKIIGGELEKNEKVEIKNWLIEKLRFD